MEHGKSTCLGQGDKRASCWNSASRLVEDKETRGRVDGTRQADLFRTRRQEGELMELGKPACLGQGDKRASCWNSASRLV